LASIAIIATLSVMMLDRRDRPAALGSFARARQGGGERALQDQTAEAAPAAAPATTVAQAASQLPPDDRTLAMLDKSVVAGAPAAQLGAAPCGNCGKGFSALQLPANAAKRSKAKAGAGRNDNLDSLVSPFPEERSHFAQPPPPQGGDLMAERGELSQQYAEKKAAPKLNGYASADRLAPMAQSAPAREQEDDLAPTAMAPAGAVADSTARADRADESPAAGRDGSSRCRQSLASYSAIIDGRAPATAALTLERALFERGKCRLEQGEREAGEVDLRAYLDRFPTGRFAREAQGLLK
jgi:hypothetical protein